MNKLEALRCELVRLWPEVRPVAELASDHPEAGTVLVAGPTGPRILGAIALLESRLEAGDRLRRPVGLRADDIAHFESQDSLAVIEVRGGGAAGSVLCRPPCTRPWGLEDLAAQLLPDLPARVGAGGPFVSSMVAPVWIGLEHAGEADAEVEVAAALLAMAATCDDGALTLAAVAASYAGSLRRILDLQSDVMQQLLACPADDLDACLDRGMARITSSGDREQGSVQSLVTLPGGNRHRELLASYGESVAALAEGGTRRLLDFHTSVAGRPFDGRRLALELGEEESAEVLRIPALAGNPTLLDHSGFTAWQLTALDLAMAGTHSTGEIHRHLLLDFPQLDVHAVAAFFREPAGRGRPGV